jgi:uncharacterized protein GlcG (DUF336 family)
MNSIDNCSSRLYGSRNVAATANIAIHSCFALRIARGAAPGGLPISVDGEVMGIGVGGADDETDNSVAEEALKQTETVEQFWETLRAVVCS